MTIIDRVYGVTGSAAVKVPCAAATTANITLSGLQTIDGVALAVNDRVLVKNQTTASENGIWLAALGSWTRSPDFNGQYDVVQGTTVLVLNGTANGSKYWRLDTAAPAIGTSSLSFTVATVVNGNLAAVPDNTLKGNVSGSTASPSDLTGSQATSILAATNAATATGTSTSALTTPANVKYGVQNGTWFAQTGTSATARSVIAKLRDTVSVKDFGAVGDGVTDDAVAIQAAVNACAGKTLMFPPGTYIVGTLIALVSDSHLVGEQGVSILKLKSKSWAVATGLLLEAAYITDVHVEGLTFDGNKGNVGSGRSPIIVCYRSQRTLIKNCTFTSAEGVCLNLSTDIDDIRVEGCRFLNCGGNPDNSDGYRRQAIAFSGTSPYRTRNVVIRDNYFYRQGLDCISLNDCDNVIIANNISDESYTFVYSVGSPSLSTNVVIDGNVVRTCSEFGGATAEPPNAVDILNVTGLSVTGNTFYDIDASAIGIFDDTKYALVTGNVIINPMRVSPNFVSGICVTTASHVHISGNTIVDTASPALMGYGINIKNTATYIVVEDNMVINPLTARYAYYSGAIPIAANSAAVTSMSQIDATARIVDLDSTNNQKTTYGRVTIVADSGSGNALNLSGSLGRKAPVTKTGNFSLAATENWVICNGSGSITMTLPTASSWTGREVMIKTIAAQTVVSASSNVVPLAGGSAGTAILAATAGKWAVLVSDGTNWVIMAAA